MAAVPTILFPARMADRTTRRTCGFSAQNAMRCGIAKKGSGNGGARQQTKAHRAQRPARLEKATESA